MSGGTAAAVSLLLLLATASCRAEVTDSELSRFMQSIWNSDVNRLSLVDAVRLNLQSRTYTSSSTDRAPARLFTSVPNLSKKSTYKKFIALLDNYNPYIDQTDRASSSEKREQQVFVASILGTPIWQLTRRFLISEGYLQSYDDLADRLASIWFREYSRKAGKVGSSGFEHVFAGELDPNTKQISGLHNWVTAYLREKEGKVNYQGYISKPDKLNTQSIKLTWGDYSKFSLSMFVGTSPEFEMALYTTCFLVRPNGECQFQINQKDLTIRTYSSYNGGLGTAYPKV